MFLILLLLALSLVSNALIISLVCGSRTKNLKDVKKNSLKDILSFCLWCWMVFFLKKDLWLWLSHLLSTDHENYLYSCLLTMSTTFCHTKIYCLSSESYSCDLCFISSAIECIKKEFMQKLITDTWNQIVVLKSSEILWLACREWKGEKGTDFIYDRLTYVFIYDRLTYVCGHQQSNFQPLSVNTAFLFIVSLRRMSPEDKTWGSFTYLRWNLSFSIKTPEFVRNKMAGYIFSG